ncbi:DNA internalization-related competence protein ComEC/Rec2 [Isobaculum melis]|uniref:Competence protein ComEC n=1 Tax=Isobaculum melis TaxID=142588 RepID=A0A1H9RXB2_9LACT|nr:DNA internalization-related competence protein ComEC/Rec2 [Isobaculum melis]SER76549.1 competence protein ComEC [Isobaculum melis]
MKGYLIFPGILSLLIVVALFYPNAIFIYLLLLLFLFRLGHTKCLKVISLTIFCGLVVLLVGYFKIYHVSTLLNGTETQLQVQVAPDGIKVNGNLLRLQGSYQTDKGKETLILFYTLANEEEQKAWQKQSDPLQLEVIGTLECPEGNRNRYQFNYQQYLKHQGIQWVMSIDQIKKQQVNQPNWWAFDVRLTKLRIQAIQTLEQKFNQRSFSYIVALVIGNGDFIEPEYKEIQQQLGIVPLFVISGLHIHFLCQFIEYFLLRIGVTKEKSQCLLLVGLLIYGQFVGFGVSVMRVVLIHFFTFLAALLKQRFASLDYFFLALIVSLLYQPQFILNIGFQLSYGVTAIFLLFGYLVQPLSSIKKNLFLSFLASLFSAPILAFHFFEIPLYSMLFNCLLLPFFEWVLIPLCFFLCLVGLCFSATSLVLTLVVQLSNGIFLFLDDLLMFFGKLPYLTFVTGRLSIFTISIYFCGFFGLLIYLYQPKKFYRSISSILVCCLFILVGSIQIKNYFMAGEVMMIDVGQGDAILIRLPNHQGDYLIDTGGQISYEKAAWQIRSNEQSLAKKTLIPYLKSEGITRLETVFITHAHLDHFGALEELSEEIQIDEVVFPKGSDKSSTFSTVLNKLDEKGLQLTPVLAETTYQKQSFSAEILFPFKVETGGNNDSLVLQTTFGTLSWLFVGDLEKEGEAELLKKYPQLKIDVLKIGHHGSKTSSSAAFIEQLQPTYGLISCGKKNRFDHPHKITLDQLLSSQVMIYRTDLQGAIYMKYMPNEHEPFQKILTND